jgi:phosphohistidine phosphatase
MRLILFRHGPAEERDAARWPDDRLRPLTERGIRRTRRAARGLVQLESDIARIFSSPALRALATARLLAEALPHPSDPVLLDALAPDAPWRDTASLLHSEPPDRTVVLVGHEPALGMLAGALLCGEPRALALKKAGACAIEWIAPSLGGGRLLWWLGPGPLQELRRRHSGSVA